ncbi:hypothetical protein [Streptomyces sp. NPDC054783]
MDEERGRGRLWVMDITDPVAADRIPFTRAPAADPGVPPAVRAKAAALLTEDLGEEGRNILRDLSGSHTAGPGAHLAAASAGDGLDVDNEAVAAYRRVLESESAKPPHRVRAAQGRAAYRPVHDLTREVLRAVPAVTSAPVPARVEAARALLGPACSSPPAHLEHPHVPSRVPRGLRYVDDQ